MNLHFSLRGNSLAYLQGSYWKGCTDIYYLKIFLTCFEERLILDIQEKLPLIMPTFIYLLADSTSYLV